MACAQCIQFFGVSRSTGYEAETEFYHNDAKTFIRESLGEDYMTFVHNLDCENIRAELQEIIWFDLVRPACMSVSGRASDPLSSEACQVYEKVSLDFVLYQRCFNEVEEQEIAKAIECQLRQAVVDAFSKICVKSCEATVIRPLMVELNLLEEFESASPYYKSETDGQLYLEFPSLLAPMMGPDTKYDALFDTRAMFQPCREALLKRYGGRMTVFRDKFLDVIQGVEMDGPLWGNVVQVADLLNELQNSNKPRSGPFEGFLHTSIQVTLQR